ncbi:MAG: hypothetical protein AAFV59_16400 [Pseudomonadota bacterium]
MKVVKRMTGGERLRMFGLGVALLCGAGVLGSVGTGEMAQLGTFSLGLLGVAAIFGSILGLQEL